MPRVFISCVSAELRGYRDALRQRLTSQERHIMVQEDFTDGDATLLGHLAGQQVPANNPPQPWAEYASAHPLLPITDEEHWCEFGRRVLELPAEQEAQIPIGVRATKGSPRSLCNLLANVQASFG